MLNLLEHVHGAALRRGIDARHAASSIPATEIKVKVTVEDTVGLSRVQMPDQGLVVVRRRWRHHLIGSS